ncbi:MAG TPA: hypothetical protein VD770_05460, partial [Coxiellaceae bacterium]|nr:hypothetical protein [Coxiellaceae bacterium]
KIFLELRGHDIQFPTKKSLKDFKDELLTKAENHGLEYIPLDLALVFFKLNKKMRAQANVELKSKIKASEELSYKAGSVLKTIPASDSGYEIEGLVFQPIPADGHCLFNAVALHIGQDQATLRNRIAAQIEHRLNELHDQELRDQIEALNPYRTAEQYLEALRRGEEWADNLEITVLMRLLDRPIVVIGPDRKVRNAIDLEGFSGEPIFVQYNGHNHYNAYLLQEGWHGREILGSLTHLDERSHGMELTNSFSP